MTMMMTNSQFGLEDMEALLWGPSSPMADPMGSMIFHPDQEEQHGGASLEGGTSPLTSSSLSSSSSPPPFYTPPPSPPAVLLRGDKVGPESDLLSLPWLDHPGQLRCSQMVAADCKEDAFGDLDWMAQRVDLSELDLDSLIGSCSPTEEASSTPEDLLASLDCPMELDCLPTLSTPALPSFPSASPPDVPPPPSPTPCSDTSFVPVVELESIIERQEAPSPPPCVPEPQEELEIKSEPASPDPSSPPVDASSSPACTLDLGSEVDVSESEVEVSEVKPVVASVIPQVQRLVLSLSPTRIVLVLAPKNELGITTTTVTTTSQVDGSPPPPSVSPSPRSTRGRPYPEPKFRAGPSSPSSHSVKVKSLRGTNGEERLHLKAPKDKKLKKMEQNKTAATRYRQKKRAEQEALLSEHTVLERKNMELKEKAESMAREIEYLKELMEEVRLARIKKGLSADP